MENEQNQNSNSTTLPPAPQQPIVEPEKSSFMSSKWIKIGIGFAILVILLGGIYTLGRSSVLKELNPTSPIIPSKSPDMYQGSPSPTSNPTANWKTYINTKYGYSVKIPKDWKIDTQGGVDQSTFIAPYLDSPCNYDGGILCSTILVSATGAGTNSTAIISNKKDILLDNQSASSFEAYDPSYGNNLGRFQYVISVKHNGLDYGFVYEESKKNKTFKSTSDFEDKKTFDIIMSTFKFTDLTSSNDTSAWKTYTNPQFGYSFKYPSNATIKNEDAYSFMTAKNVKVISLIRNKNDLEKSNDWEKWYELQIYTEENPNNLSPKELIDNYLKPETTTQKRPGHDLVSGAVNTKINESLKEYKIGEINGLHAIFGFDYDYDVIVATKNNKIYTFLYYGDQGGKISGDAERTVNQILSSFKFN